MNELVNALGPGALASVGAFATAAAVFIGYRLMEKGGDNVAPAPGLNEEELDAMSSSSSRNAKNNNTKSSGGASKKANNKKKKGARAPGAEPEAQQQEQKEPAPAQRKPEVPVEQPKAEPQQQQQPKKKQQQQQPKKEQQQQQQPKKEQPQQDKPAAANGSSAAAGDSAAAKKKKKRNKKKSGSAASQESAAADDEEAAIAAARAAAADAAASELARAPAAAGAVEDEWEEVSRRRKKPTATAAAGVAGSNGAVATSDGKASSQVHVGDLAPKLIGPGGARIKQLREDTGAEIEIDRETKVCTITGTPEAVQAAQDFVSELLNNQRQDLMDLGAKRSLVFPQLRGIQQDSGARLDLERGSSVLELSGDAEAVARARAQIQAILDSAQVGTVVLEPVDVPCIIGRQGVHVRAIQAESGATLDIDSDLGFVSLTGEPQQVQRAKELIALYVQHRGPPPEAIEKVSLPREDTRLVIGPGGETIKRLERESGARIRVVGPQQMQQAPNEDADGEPLSEVTLSGSTDSVRSGVALLRKLLEDHSHEARVPLANPALIRAVLGTGGAVINSIRDKSGARITLSESNTTPEVICRGTQAQTGKAQQLVEDVIRAEMGPPPVPEGQELWEADLGDATGMVIGSSGSNIGRLQKTHGVKIHVRQGTMCYVVGPPAGVSGAKKEIMQTLERREESILREQAQREAAEREAEEARTRAEQEQAEADKARAEAVAALNVDSEAVSSAAAAAANSGKPTAAQVLAAGTSSSTSNGSAVADEQKAPEAHAMHSAPPGLSQGGAAAAPLSSEPEKQQRAGEPEAAAAAAPKSGPAWGGNAPPRSWGGEEGSGASSSGVDGAGTGSGAWGNAASSSSSSAQNGNW